MDEIIDNCEVLASTGVNQLLIILIALFMLATAVALIASGRSQKLKFVLAGVGVLFGFMLIFAPVSSYAQSVNEDCIEQTDDGSENDDELVGVLGLVDDSAVMQLPNFDEGLEETFLYLAILANDTATSEDPIDLSTVDLDPIAPGQQTSFYLTHPDDADFICGQVSLGTLGILIVTLQDPCLDGDFNDLSIPPDYTISPFTYTAQTVGGLPAPSPATVTIITQADAPEQIVYADIHSTCLSSFPITFDLTNNASTSVGAIDSASVDLNPSLPGQQTSFTTEIAGVTYTGSVDSNGELTINASDEFATLQTFYYTISNTLGTVSNINAYGYNIVGSCE